VGGRLGDRLDSRLDGGDDFGFVGDGLGEDVPERVGWVVEVFGPGGETLFNVLCDALASLGFGDFGAGSEGAKGGIGDDLFDEIGGVVGIAVACGDGGAGEVEAGDLEAVEEETGAEWVDVVGGDAAEDLADAALDGGAVLGVGEVEGGAAAAALARVFGRAAGGVVVVAELFVAEAGRAATASVGEDVAALVAFGFGCVWCGVRHGAPLPVKVRKVFETRWIGSYLVRFVCAREKPGLVGRALCV
jgi:hypothetical protein